MSLVSASAARISVGPVRSLRIRSGCAALKPKRQSDHLTAFLHCIELHAEHMMCLACHLYNPGPCNRNLDLQKKIQIELETATYGYLKMNAAVAASHKGGWHQINRGLDIEPPGLI